MPKNKLVLAYDGTHYSGWQIQPNAPSIQEHVENALATLLKEPTRLVGAGRTDAGVHAKGQVAHFSSEKPFDQLHSLNGILPNDIRILSLVEVPDTFHAQYAAIGKEYHYHIWWERTIDPFVRHYRHKIASQYPIEQVQQIANLFVGEHDFATFANVGGSVKTTVRTIDKIAVVAQEGGFRFEFYGRGFLYKMVRNIVGTILDILSGKLSCEVLPALFAARDRRAAGLAAPSKGLFLIRVDYPENVEKRSEKEGT